jgi:hypothetical protein
MITNNQFIGLRQADAIAKSFQQDSVQLPSLDNLQKGEGERGGKVIGHTKSGKAIYDHFAHSGHKDFNATDHLNAADLHTSERKKAQKSKDSKAEAFHYGHGLSHLERHMKMTDEEDED